MARDLFEGQEVRPVERKGRDLFADDAAPSAISEGGLYDLPVVGEWLKSFSDTTGNFQTGFADTATLGTADEIGAGINAPLSPKSYDELVTENRDALADSGTAGTAGQLLGAVMLPGGGIRAGAAQGAAYGFGSGEGDAVERLPGAVAGGVLGAGLGAAARGVEKSLARRGVVSSAAKAAPTREALKGSVDDAYKTLREAGITYDGAAWQGMADKIRADLLKDGFRPKSIGKEAFDYVDDWGKAAPDFDDVNNIRKQATGQARAARARGDGETAKAWDKVTEHLDEFETSAPLTSTAPLSREFIDAKRSEARKLAFRNIKQRSLDEIVENAETYQSGYESGIRNGVSNLLRSKKGKQMFNDAERELLKDVAQGRKPLQMLGRFGLDFSRLNLGGGGAMLPGAALLLDPLGAGGATALVGTAAKALSPKLTERSLERAGAAIRSGNVTEGTLKRLMTPGLLGAGPGIAGGLLGDRLLERRR